MCHINPAPTGEIKAAETPVAEDRVARKEDPLIVRKEADASGGVTGCVQNGKTAYRITVLKEPVRRMAGSV
jgi:Tfp pilus assembly protein FimV